MRKSSRGNPWHDALGRFCHGPTATVDTWGNEITDEQRKEYVCMSERTKEEYAKRTVWAEKERESMMVMKDNLLAHKLYKEGFLDKDTALELMRNGEIKKEVKRYCDILLFNGDPTPTKKTVDKQRHLEVDSEYGGDWDKARICEIQKDTGMSFEESERTYNELQLWMGSHWDKADRDTLDNYIEKSPAYDGEIHRGLHFNHAEYDEFMKTIKSGVVCMRGNSSWTSDYGVARKFANTVDDNIYSVVITCMKNRTSTPIEHLKSVNGGEDEVLAHSKASWTVLSVDEYEKYARITVIERGEYYELNGKNETAGEFYPSQGC